MRCLALHIKPLVPSQKGLLIYTDTHLSHLVKYIKSCPSISNVLSKYAFSPVCSLGPWLWDVFNVKSLIQEKAAGQQKWVALRPLPDVLPRSCPHGWEILMGDSTCEDCNAFNTEGILQGGTRHRLHLAHPHKIPWLPCNLALPPACTCRVAGPALGVGGHMESCMPLALASPMWVWMMALQLISSHPIQVTHPPYHLASSPIKLGFREYLDCRLLWSSSEIMHRKHWRRCPTHSNATS